MSASSFAHPNAPMLLSGNSVLTFVRQSDHAGITGGGPWNVAGFCKASAASGTGA
jgi:hypothetical protein